MSGGGHFLLEAAMKDDLLLTATPLFLVSLFLVTVANYASGAPGGIFAPLLVLGTLTGLATGQIAHTLLPEVVPLAGTFAAVGLAASFYQHSPRPANRHYACHRNDGQPSADVAIIS